MYHNDPKLPPACVWCGQPNHTTLVLCDVCEERVKYLMQLKGLPVRPA